MLANILALLFAASSSAAVPRVDAVEIVVRDLAGERRFFENALEFKEIGERAMPGETIDRLELGGEHIDLVHYDVDGNVIPLAARSSDRTFQHVAVIVSDMERAWKRVRAYAIRPVSTAPQVLPAWNPNAGGIAAVYFRDPEGHPLELLHFPPGKGAPQWQRRTALFLGIDHTAIAVADTPASTRFYEVLGLRVRGRSNNYGIEQQRLSGVAGAHVAITAVRFASAPGIEFLHYLAPAVEQGPERASPFDLIATRTRIVTRRASASCAALTSVAAIPGGCIVRDPDGHLVELAAP